jgi:hypothetical protein
MHGRLPQGQSSLSGQESQNQKCINLTLVLLPLSSIEKRKLGAVKVSQHPCHSRPIVITYTAQPVQNEDVESNRAKISAIRFCRLLQFYQIIQKIKKLKIHAPQQFISSPFLHVSTFLATSRNTSYWFFMKE